MLEVTHLSKTYGDGDRAVPAVGDLTFRVQRGEFVCIVGPSGCGKTTLLKCVSGLIQPTSGTATLAGKRIDGPPQELAVVFQEYSRSLLPWLTVGGNVDLVLRNKGLKRDERRRLIEANLAAVGLVEGPAAPDRIASSDIGNVSQVTPTIHAWVAIAPLGTAIHTREFAAAATAPAARAGLLAGAKLMALSVADLLADPSRLAAMKEEFMRR